MNLARPVRATKVRQQHAAAPLHKPGRPQNGPNYVAPRPASAKKNARSAARSRKSGKSA